MHLLAEYIYPSVVILRFVTGRSRSHVTLQGSLSCVTGLFSPHLRLVLGVVDAVLLRGRTTRSGGLLLFRLRPSLVSSCSNDVQFRPVRTALELHGWLSSTIPPSHPSATCSPQGIHVASRVVRFPEVRDGVPIEYCQKSTN